MVLEHSFDAWGRIRDPETWAQQNSPFTKGVGGIINDRGYTGHEMLPQFGIINMNGRLYDPILGRMLSPDNYIQMPDFTQNFNRYSYVLNNPLKYVDPNGDFAWGVFAVGAVIGGIQGHIMALKAGYSLGDWQFYAYGVVGSNVGGFSAVAGNWASNMTQALGAIPGAAVGTGTGAVIGGATSVIQGGAINVIEGKSFSASWEKDLISGASSGAIFGALSGGVAGYKRAQVVGANKWTGEGYGETHWRYQKPLKNVPLNRDEDGYCYAYEGEYNDQGHLNRNHQEFIDAANNEKGADMYDTWESLNNGEYRLSGAGTDRINEMNINDWRNVGQHHLAPNNKEVGIAIQSIGKGHGVALTGIEYVEKYKIFGGGTKNVLYFNIWDPSKGHLDRQTLTILQMLFIEYR